MVLLIVTIHHAGAHMSGHLTQLPTGVIGVDGWTNRLYVVSCCTWTLSRRGWHGRNGIAIGWLRLWLQSSAMPTRSSLRAMLAQSHVAAVAVALLLLYSISNLLRALWIPTERFLTYAGTALLIMDAPYYSQSLTIRDRGDLIFFCSYAYMGLTRLLGAWLLARWALGSGPLAALARYWSILNRRRHV